MAEVIIPNEGKVWWLDWAGPGQTYERKDFHLTMFSNDYEPHNGSVVADFDAASFGGTPIVELDRALFSPPVIVANIAYSTYPDPPMFEMISGAPVTCYGWVMYDKGGPTVILAASRFDTPRLMRVGSVEVLDPFKLKLREFGAF